MNKQSKKFPAITRPDGYRIESWYDRHTRSWITKLIDSGDNQVGDAQYDSRHESVKASRKMLTEIAIEKYAPNYAGI